VPDIPMNPPDLAGFQGFHSRRRGSETPSTLGKLRITASLASFGCLARDVSGKNESKLHALQMLRAVRLRLCRAAICGFGPEI
jgi:hypothetical protein